MLYPAVVFLTSAGALTLEIVAGRLIAPYVGMSLYTWTAIIAVVLAGLSLGHWVGGRLADSHDDNAVALNRISVSLAAGAITTLASLPLLRSLAAVVLSTGEGAIAPVVTLTGILFFLPSMFIGIISPIATKLALEEKPNQMGPVLGRMFASGALGSILGTLLSGYVFISWIGSTGTVLAVSALYAVLAIGFGVRARFRAPKLLVLIVTALPVGIWGHLTFAFTSPCDVESDYFCIRVNDFSDVTDSDSRVMALDHLVHSINERNDPELLYSPYIHFVDEVMRRKFPPIGNGGDGRSVPEAAFFIGGGGYTLPRAWQNIYPQTRLEVAEIDPVVTKVAISDMWVDPSLGMMKIHHKDARVALQERSPGPHFDIVFGDAFHDIAVPPHLVTREFSRVIAERLKPGGFYVMNAVDKAASPGFLFALIRTLGFEFEAVDVWMANDVMKDDERVTYIVVASDSYIPVSQFQANNGYERGWVRWPQADLKQRIQDFDPPILTDSYAPVERLLTARKTGED